MASPFALHAEKRVDRFKPGTTHPIFGAIPAIGCIPVLVAANTKTGTFTTNNAAINGYAAGTIVFGTGTLFLTEGLQQGDFLYNAGKVRRIKYVESETRLVLEYAFPANLTDQAVVVPYRNKYEMVIIKSTSSSTDVTAVQECPMAFGELIVTGGSPITYDTTAGSLEFTCSV